MKKRGFHLFNAGSRWLIVFSLYLVFTGVASAQITLDNRASQGAFSAAPAANALSWTHTVNSCSHCVLYVGVTTFSSVPDVLPVLTVTYTNGGQTTPTAIGSQLSSLTTTGNSSVQLYRIIAPPVGTGTISVTSSVLTNYLFGSSFSFNGVNQTTPNGPWNSAIGNSSSPALTVTGDATGSVVLDLLGSTPTAGYFVPNSGQIVCTTGDETSCTRGRGFFSSIFDVGAMSYKYAAAPGTVDQWSMTTADVWALGAIAITYDGTTAGEIQVTGQLRTPDGTPIVGAYVVAQDSKGEVHRAMSSPFGYFTLFELEAGTTYAVSVSSKSYTFQSIVITAADSGTGSGLISIISENSDPLFGLPGADPTSSRSGSLFTNRRPLKP